MKQQINDLLNDIETFIDHMMPDGGASHRFLLHRLQRFPDIELRREFDKRVARRDFKAARSTLQRMMEYRDPVHPQAICRH